MPAVRRAAREAAAALALAALLLAAPVAHAESTLPPQVETLAAVTSFYMLTGDVKSASSYSTLLCQLLAALPPGALAQNPDEAYRLAYLASIRLYAPGYVDYQLMQLVYEHLVDGQQLPPSYCGSAAPPASTPPSSDVAKLIEEAEKGTGYEAAYNASTDLISKSVGLVEPNYTAGGTPPPPPLEQHPATSVNLTAALRELLERLPSGLNASITRRVSIEALTGLTGGEFGGKGVELPRLGGVGGFQPPPVNPPSLPSFTLPSLALPPLNPWLFAVVAAAVAAVVLAYKAGDLARLLSLARRRAALRRRIIEAAERGDVDAVVEAFAELLELLGEECRPKRPDETHREYSRVLRGEALREYLRAALLYEAAKFGGARGPEAARAIREAAERLLERLECSEEG